MAYFYCVKEYQRLVLEQGEVHSIISCVLPPPHPPPPPHTLTSGRPEQSVAQRHLGEIHRLKERLQRENNALKDTKQQLRDIQEKIKAEKEVLLVKEGLFKNIAELMKTCFIKHHFTLTFHILHTHTHPHLSHTCTHTHTHTHANTHQHTHTHTHSHTHTHTHRSRESRVVCSRAMWN